MKNESQGAGIHYGVHLNAISQTSLNIKRRRADYVISFPTDVSLGFRLSLMCVQTVDAMWQMPETPGFYPEYYTM